MADAYEVKLDKFSGPLEALLELIEGRKLAVGEVSLAQVTDDFLKYLAQLKTEEVVDDAGRISGLDLRIIADFLVIASRLIFIKSKFLLPELTFTTEEEADIKDLEHRLKLYQDVKPALKLLAALWRKHNREYARPYFLVKGLGVPQGAGIFYPGNALDIHALRESLAKIFDTLIGTELETQTIREKIITIEEKIEEIVQRMQREGETRFNSLSSGKSRAEMIAIFLAVLHLAREQLVLLEQTSHFSDIIIRKQEPPQALSPEPNGTN